LEALFGDAAREKTANDFEYLPLQRIEPRPEQPRSVFEQSKIDELTDSIREHGIIMPLTVRSAGDGYYQIIAGERRWRAARAAGLAEIPARIIVADDVKATELALVENLQREDLNPIEEARGYKTLIDETGMTQEDVAQSIGKSRPAVANALRLLALPDMVIEFIESGELSAGSARALLALKNSEMMIAAAQKTMKENLSVRDVETLVKKMNKEEPDRDRISGNGVDYLVEAKNRLEQTLGRRVTIVQGRGKGRIVLDYYGQEDFDALFDKLLSMPHSKSLP